MSACGGAPVASITDTCVITRTDFCGAEQEENKQHTATTRVNAGARSRFMGSTSIQLAILWETKTIELFQPARDDAIRMEALLSAPIAAREPTAHILLPKS